MKGRRIAGNVRRTVCLVLSLSVLLAASHTVEGSGYFSMITDATAQISHPPVILQNLSNSLIYVDSTSAKVSVSNETSALEVLGILNQTEADWQLQLSMYSDDNTNRLSDCTIWFKNASATSTQIKLVNGEYDKTSGEYFDLVGDAGECIVITAFTNAAETSYIHTYLKILKLGTSTYHLYIITFEIT